MMNSFAISGVIRRYVYLKRKGDLRNSRAMMDIDNLDSIPLRFQNDIPIRGKRIHAIGKLRGLIRGGVCLEVHSWRYVKSTPDNGEKPR